MRNVLMVAAENGAINNVKVGGIGDVIRDIPKYLVKQDVCVDVILPSYGFIVQENQTEFSCEIEVPFCGLFEKVRLYKLQKISSEGCNQWVLDHPAFTTASRSGIYSDAEFEEGPFAFDAHKFALFGSAVCTLLRDIWRDRIGTIHLHDWHAAFIAVIREFDPGFSMLKHYPCAYTIHNLAIQGIRPFNGATSSFNAWFPNLPYDKSLLADPMYPECFNPVRSAINLVDKVHVVSPTYALEITQASDHQRGFYGGENLHLDLQNALAQRRLIGILNGCDYDAVEVLNEVSWETFYQSALNTVQLWMSQDRHIASCHYLAQQRLIQWQNSPMAEFVVTSVGRLTGQKFDLLLKSTTNGEVIIQILESLAACSGRLIVIGSGDGLIEDKLCQLMGQYENLLFLNGYSDKLPDILYQLGNLFLMPSSFEPCGISQMLAMRNGQPCLVHGIGGLADTVKHLENGFVFHGKDEHEQVEDLLKQFELTIELFCQEKSTWYDISNCARQSRFSWEDSVQKYITELYRFD
ncbi:glycogen synthase [Thalassotalea fusca]